MVEMLIQAEKENAPDFITAFSDCLRQVSNVQISTQSGSTCEKAYIKHVELMQNKVIDQIYQKEVPPAEFLLWKINDTEGVTSIEKQIEKFVRGERLNETGMPPHETYPCYCKIATSQLGRGVVVESIPLRPTTDIREATI
ncbi:hypothetical protein GLOIN_2v1562052 [Rhizophagus irregularis DAOM 181602=DAOM 197198]|nr:hypothetical protein GLOIN_2v1562052 [Rhizophagus irregularis DAOM 181602=DAOM 197198]